MKRKTKSKLNDCGLHYSITGGKCAKCSYFREYDRKYRDRLQWNGTPYSALIGRRVC